jgi:hypothetical protein
MPYTPKEEMTKTNNKLLFKLNNLVYKSKEITTQPTKLKNKVKNGPKINKKLFVFEGIISSLITNFKPSAKGCKKPQIPTIFGPFLLCIEAITFLSAKVKKSNNN